MPVYESDDDLAGTVAPSDGNEEAAPLLHATPTAAYHGAFPSSPSTAPGTTTSPTSAPPAPPSPPPTVGSRVLDVLGA